MAYYGTLRNYRFAEKTADDIRGSAVYGVDDDKLGKIDDVIFDGGTGDIRYVIIDTGGWLSTKRFIVPADRLYSSAAHPDDFEVYLTKKQVESFPPYDENAVESQQTWGEYETKYRSAWPATSATHTGQVGRRWTSFENRLRADRDRIVAHTKERKVS